MGLAEGIIDNTCLVLFIIEVTVPGPLVVQRADGAVIAPFRSQDPAADLLIPSFPNPDSWTLIRPEVGQFNNPVRVSFNSKVETVTSHKDLWKFRQALTMTVAEMNLMAVITWIPLYSLA